MKWSIFRGRLRGLVRWLRKIEQPKAAGADGGLMDGRCRQISGGKWTGV
jgi:hypothetical protein